MKTINKIRRMISGWATVLCLLMLGSCAAPTQEVEIFMGHTIEIKDIQLDKAFYYPKEQIKLSVEVVSDLEQAQTAWLLVEVSHLADRIESSRQEVVLNGKEQIFSASINPPATAPRGYGIELYLESNDGNRLAQGSAAFDVLNHWTEAPRYGFLSEFGPGRSDAGETMEILARYHINALQFYDWMYRHEQFLTTDEPYIDLLGRQLSRKTVDELIEAAHEHNIAAMPYTAVYGSSLAFYEEHPDWAVYNRKGEPVLFGEDFMAIMDPRPESPWTQHLLGQFEEVLEKTKFDGIHLDQYGDPKEGYTAEGIRYDLAPALADLIDATKEITIRQRTEAAVVFNAVTNWPIEAVAPAGQDIVYIEVWSPYNWFTDLRQLIVEAQSLGNGKPVVLAAYIDPAHTHNVQLMNALIFSSGGGHIELGEQAGGQPVMLADPYFPKFQEMSAELAEAVRRMYAFSVRYQDVFGPRTQDATRDYQNRIKIQGVNTAPGARKDKVIPVVRSSEKALGLSLINLVGVQQAEWKNPIPAPPATLEHLQVEISGIERSIAKAWLASPDGDNLAAQELIFSQEGDVLRFEVPSLFYWDLIVLEWSE